MLFSVVNSSKLRLCSCILARMVSVISVTCCWFMFDVLVRSEKGLHMLLSAVLKTLCFIYWSVDYIYLWKWWCESGVIHIFYRLFIRLCTFHNLKIISTYYLIILKLDGEIKRFGEKFSSRSGMSLCSGAGDRSCHDQSSKTLELVSYQATISSLHLDCLSFFLCPQPYQLDRTLHWAEWKLL